MPVKEIFETILPPTPNILIYKWDNDKGSKRESDLPESQQERMWGQGQTPVPNVYPEPRSFSLTWNMEVLIASGPRSCAPEPWHSSAMLTEVAL